MEQLEPRDKDALCSLFAVASQMRKWTHEAKNSLSERIDAEVEQRHRKEKETKLEQAAKVVKIEPAEV